VSHPASAERESTLPERFLLAETGGTAGAGVT
jgi:hypothetical protein